MKLRYLACLPFLLGASLPIGVEDPEYGCDLDKNYCVVKADALHDLIAGARVTCEVRIKT